MTEYWIEPPTACIASALTTELLGPAHTTPIKSYVTTFRDHSSGTDGSEALIQFNYWV